MLEESEFSSVYEHIRRVNDEDLRASNKLRVPLLAFANTAEQSEVSIPFSLSDYIALVDWMRSVRRGDRRGAIDRSLPPIFKRLNIDSQAWQAAMQPRGNVFGRALGKLDHLRLHAKTLGQQWIKGLGQSERMYGSS